VNDDEEDFLDPGRRLWPHWAVALAVAVLIAGVVGVVVIRGEHGEHPHATASLSGLPGPTPPGPVTQVGASDIAMDGAHVYLLAHGTVYALDADQPGFPVTAEPVGLSGLDLTDPSASNHLVLDRVRSRLWMVTFGAVVEFDPANLTQLRRLRLPEQVSAAAALDGVLYLATDSGVVTVAPDTGHVGRLGALSGHYLDVAADAGRHRLLLFRYERGHAELLSYTPQTAAPSLPVSSPPNSSSSAASPDAITTVRAPFGKGTVVVVDGAIWAGGYGDQGAVLDRLDPATLRSVGHSEITPLLGPGAVLVAVGQSDLWVRSGGGGSGLWCVDGGTGAVLQSWDVSGPVASRTGRAVVAGGGGPTRLDLAGCKG
jgi:hypothetical protein